MGSPFSGRGRNFMIAPSVGMKSWAAPCYQVLRDEVTHWVVCGPWSTFYYERRISLAFGLSFFGMRSRRSFSSDQSDSMVVPVILTVTVVVISFSLLQGKGFSVSVVSFYSYGLHSGLALKSWDLVSSQEISSPTS